MFETIRLMPGITQNVKFCFPECVAASEGFSFNSGGLGVEPCSRPVVSKFATVRNRSQPSAVER